MAESADNPQNARNVHVDFFEREFPIFVHIKQYECHPYLSIGGPIGGTVEASDAGQLRYCLCTTTQGKNIYSIFLVSQLALTFSSTVDWHKIDMPQVIAARSTTPLLSSKAR